MYIVPVKSTHLSNKIWIELITKCKASLRKIGKLKLICCNKKYTGIFTRSLLTMIDRAKHKNTLYFFFEYNW